VRRATQALNSGSFASAVVHRRLAEVTSGGLPDGIAVNIEHQDEADASARRNAVAPEILREMGEIWKRTGQDQYSPRRGDRRRPPRRTPTGLVLAGIAVARPRTCSFR